MRILTRTLALSLAASSLFATWKVHAADALADVPKAAAVDPLQRPAEMAPRAARAVMLAVATAGSRAVAAGERGIVLWSDDDGKTWQQATVPVSVTLTGMSFPTPRQGWAVGHGGAVLHSDDAGQSWVRQLDGRAAALIELEAARASGDPKRVVAAEQLVADGPDKPLLAVHFWNPRRGFVIGAYGLIFGTEDGGVTWSSWADRIQNLKGRHLNALYVSGETVFIAGEQGLILRSLDNAHTFQALESPYNGSWFAISGSGSNVVVAGLRGNVFRSTNAGASWVRVQVPVPITIGSTITTRHGSVLFANLAGMLLASTDAGQSLRSLPGRQASPLTALAESSSGALLAASFAGPMQLPAPNQATPTRNP